MLTEKVCPNKSTQQKGVVLSQYIPFTSLFLKNKRRY